MAKNNEVSPIKIPPGRDVDVAKATVAIRAATREQDSAIVKIGHLASIFKVIKCVGLHRNRLIPYKLVSELDGVSLTRIPTKVEIVRLMVGYSVKFDT
ncbi:hypothetical protein G4B88_031426 [Cannabis sativa]|uniref:Uncharacterized protein n=1 Tax=Cannabis sativa TaxID=3483 RepID=A0A7J6F5T5_CANSA|nr:hypothetical protein G4B88_031426 [Cannabis sativa]